VPRRQPPVLSALVLLAARRFRRKLTYLAKGRYFDTWRTAWFFRSAGQIPSPSGGGQPPSARSTTPPRSGAGQAAGRLTRGDAGLWTTRCTVAAPRGPPGRESAVPVIPVGIIGTVRSSGNRRMMRPFHRVTIGSGPPHAPQSHGASELDHAELREFTARSCARSRACRGARTSTSTSEALSAIGRLTVADRNRRETPCHFHRLA